MRVTMAIARRELAAYFNSPVAYIVVTAFLLMSGYLFFTELFLSKQAELRSFFGLAPTLFLFLAPAVTMRLLAEERGTGTIELLITMPVRDWDVVLGKFWAAWGLLSTAVALTLAYPLTVSLFGAPDRGPIIAGYFGLLLLGGAYLSVGVAASAFTKNQIIASIVSFAILFALFLVGKLVPVVPPSIGPLFDFLSIDGHFQNLERGVIDTRDVIYYLSIIGVSLLIATQSLESRKWR
jgi:ABC-2 type transport system permease protein